MLYARKYELLSYFHFEVVFHEFESTPSANRTQSKAMSSITRIIIDCKFFSFLFLRISLEMSSATRSSFKRDRSRREDSETDEYGDFGRSNKRRRILAILSTSSDSERDQETADQSEKVNSDYSTQNRSRRRRGHTLQKRTCNICKHVFKKVAHMRDHMAVHDPDRQKYRCSYPNCDKEYNEVKNWRTHFLKNHARGSQTQKREKLNQFEKKLKKVNNSL